MADKFNIIISEGKEVELSIEGWKGKLIIDNRRTGGPKIISMGYIFVAVPNTNLYTVIYPVAKEEANAETMDKALD